MLQDILSGIRVVKTFGTEEKEIERYKAVCGSYKNLCIGNEVFWNTIQPLIRILTTLSHLALMLAGGMYILRGPNGRGNTCAVYDIRVDDLRSDQLYDFSSALHCGCRRRSGARV